MGNCAMCKGASISAGDPLGGCVPEFAAINIEKQDEFFNKAKSILEEVEDVRAGIIDTKATIYELTGQDYLAEKNMKNALFAFAVSAACDLGGDIQEVVKALTVTADGVEMSADALEKLSDNNKAIYENLKTFVACCKTLPETSPETVKKMEPLIAEGGARVNAAATDATEAKLSPMQIPGAVKSIAGNFRALSWCVNNFLMQLSTPENLAAIAADITALVAAVKDLPNLKAEVDAAKEKDGGKCDAVKVTREVLTSVTKLSDADAEKAIAAGKEEADKLAQRRERTKARKEGGGSDNAANAGAGETTKKDDKDKEAELSTKDGKEEEQPGIEIAAGGEEGARV